MTLTEQCNKVIKLQESIIERENLLPVKFRDISYIQFCQGLLDVSKSMMPKPDPIIANPHVRFMKHYVTDGAKKAKVWYSKNNRSDGRDCVTIYAKEYGNDLGSIIPDGYINRTDTMTDYFDKGKVTLFADHPYYQAALLRCPV
jgi:hypothetical protein